MYKKRKFIDLLEIQKRLGGEIGKLVRFKPECAMLVGSSPTPSTGKHDYF